MSSIIALHWHNRVLRVATAQTDRGSGLVQRLFVESFAAEASLDDLRRRLANIVQANNLKGHDAVVVVDREQYELRQIAVPQAPDDELPDMVRYQAKSNFTNFGDLDIVDFIRLGGAPGATQAQLLAATLSASELKKIKSVIEPARLKLKHVVPRPFAAVNLIRSELLSGHHQLVVNEFGDEADLAVVHRDMITLTRSVRLPHETVEKNAALVREIRRTIAASRNQTSGGSIQRIVILGNEPSHTLLGNELERELKTDVAVIATCDGVQLSPEAQAGFPTDDGSMAPLLGSLNLGTEPAPHLIDFAIPRRRPERKRDTRQLAWIGGSVAALFLVALLIGIVMIASKRSEIAELRAQLKQLESQTAEAEQIIGDVGLVDQFKLGDINWLDELSELSARLPLPDDAIVTSLNGSLQSLPFQGKIGLSGLVSNADVEHEIFESLADRPYAVDMGKSSPSSALPNYHRTFAHNLELSLANQPIDPLMRQLIDDSSAAESSEQEPSSTAAEETSIEPPSDSSSQP